MTEKIANKKKTPRKTTRKTRNSLDPRRSLEETWEMVTFLGFTWEEAKTYKGAERLFLLEKAEENKIEYLKRQKEEEERRVAQERQMMAMQQQMQQQQAQQAHAQAAMQQQNPYNSPQQGFMPTPQQ